jgi:pSer/pThr/pTyr-binding forkhead associated (FHA) protein
MPDELQIPQNVALEVFVGSELGKNYPIAIKTVTIGRAQGCDIRLADNYVSNKHCQVVFRGGHFTVIDLGSLNKTKVNGTKYVQKNLLDGDILRVGKTELKFKWSEADQAAYNAQVKVSPVEADILVPENDAGVKAGE